MNEIKSQAAKSHKFFYGWYIVAIIFITMLTAYGIRFSFSVFYVAILEDFGWTRAETAGMFSINMVVYGLSSALGGFLVDRFGGRKVLSTGGLLLAATLLGMSRAASLWQFYVLYGVILGLVLSSMGYVAFATLLAPWFRRRRGAAMGIAFLGNTAGPVVSILAQYLISATGWREGFQILGIAAMVIIVPTSIFFLRNRPEDIGLVPDGGANAGNNGNATPSREDELIVNKKWVGTAWTLPMAIKTLPFWGTFAEEFLIATALNLITVHQVAYSVDLGFSKMYSATIFGLTGIFGLLGAFGGALSDRLGRERTYTLGNLGLILSLGILMATSRITQPWMLWAFAICYGIFRSIQTPLYGIITADLFQGKNFGSILGVINWGYGFGAAFGSWIAGYIFDLTGSYIVAFIIAMSAYVVAVFLVWFVVAPRRIKTVPGQIRQKEATLEQ